MLKRTITFSIVIVFIGMIFGCEQPSEYVQITVKNQTFDICTGFYTKTPSSEDWGDSHLSSNIDVQGSSSFQLLKDSYDFKATYESSEASVLENQDLSQYDVFTITLIGGAE